MSTNIIESVVTFQHVDKYSDTAVTAVRPIMNYDIPMMS